MKKEKSLPRNVTLDDSKVNEFYSGVDYRHKYGNQNVFTALNTNDFNLSPTLTTTTGTTAISMNAADVMTNYMASSQ